MSPMPRLRDPAPTVFERRAPAAAAVDHALAGAAHRVFWLDGLSRPEHPELIDQHAADLVIVGAGYHWAVDRAPGQGTGSGPPGDRPRGRSGRLGGVGSQRRLCEA